LSLLDRTSSRYGLKLRKINIVAKTLLGDCDDLVQYEEAKPELLETVDGLSVMLPICEYSNIRSICSLLALSNMVA
jgi:hypothetical protein